MNLDHLSLLYVDDPRQHALDAAQRAAASPAAARAAASPPRPAPAPAVQPQRAAGAAPAASPEKTREQLEADWRASAALQAEFPSAAVYAAYARHAAAGHVKIAPATCRRASAPAS
jgi:hypothetical protein